MRRSPVVLSLLAITLTTPVWADQTVPFQTVAQSKSSALPAGQHVVRSDQELRSLRLHRVLTPSQRARIDFQREMVIAVHMGPQASGGHAIAITRIVREGNRLVVRVRERRPGPGEIVTWALTNPFHVVKLRKQHGSVVFADADASFHAITRSRASIRNGTSVRVAADGFVTVTRRTGFSGGSITRQGRATGAEMSSLRAALRRADLRSLPDRIQPTGPTPLGMPNLTFILEDDRGTKRVSGPAVRIPNALVSRLRALRRVLDDLERRILAKPGPRSFNTITRHVSRPFPPRPGRPPFSTRSSITIRADGRVTILKGGNPFTLDVRKPITGRATPAELSRLNQVVSAAELVSLPTRLPVPKHIMAAPTFELIVTSNAFANMATLEGELGYYTLYDSRLRPVMDAIDTVLNRLDREDPMTHDVAEGTVEVGGFQGFRTVRLVANHSRIYRVKNWAFARNLIKFKGHRVRVRGRITRTGKFSADVEGEELLSPVQRDLRGRVARSQRGPVLVVGGLRPPPGPMPPMPIPEPPVFQPTFPHPTIWRPGRRVPAFGPAAPVLKRALNRHVTVDAWVFSDRRGQHQEAYINGVYGSVTEDSDLIHNRRVVNEVRKGERVLVLRLNRARDRYRVRPSQGRSGVIRARHITFGELPVWTFQPTNTVGVVGALNKNE